MSSVFISQVSGQPYACSNVSDITLHDIDKIGQYQTKTDHKTTESKHRAHNSWNILYMYTTKKRPQMPEVGI